MDRGPMEGETMPHGYTGHSDGPDVFQMWRPCADAPSCRRRMGADCWVEAALFDFASRPRRRTRARVARRLERRAAAPEEVDWIPPRERCATVHVRHGDVLLDGWQELHETYDRGVDSYLSAAAAILGQRAPNVFLMTDNADVLGDARASALGANVSSLNVSRGSHRAKLKQRDWSDLASSSDALVNILLELRAASKCQAFVGNCFSLFGRAIFRTMCLARGDCPVHHSIRSDMRCCATSHLLQQARNSGPP